MNNDLDWNQLKLVLALARAGTLAGAARTLNVSHATAFRRLGRLEKTLDVTLFERGHNGYTATAAGQRLIDAASAAEREIEAAGTSITAVDTPAGPLRITTTDLLYEGLLAPILTAFCDRYPQISLTIDISNTVHDLARRTADVAIRPSDTPPEHLIGRQLGIITQAVYVAADHAARANASSRRPWIGPSDIMGYDALALWLADTISPTDIVARVNSGIAARAAARAGAGRTVLPCYLAERDPTLQRDGPAIDALSTALWLLIRPDARGSATLRCFTAFVADGVATRLADHTV